MNFKLPLTMLIPKLQHAARTLFAFLVLLPAALGLACGPKPQPEKATTPSPTPPAAIKLDPYGGYPPPVFGKSYPGRGVVKTINLKEGWVTLDHEEIKDLMAAMTMEFWVRDRSILKGIQVGDKVDFIVVEENSKGQFLTELKKVTPAR